MAKTRITKEMREHALSKVKKIANEKAFEDIKREEQELADTAYRRIIISEELEAQLNALPKGFVPRQGYVHLVFQRAEDDYGTQIRMRLTFRDHRDRPLSISASHGWFSVVDTDLHAKAEEVTKRRNAIVKELEKLVADTDATIKQTRYVEDLQKAAPNLAKLLPEVEPKSMLPSLLIGDVTSRLLAAGVLEAAP